MRNSKVKSKRNLAIPGDPMSKEEFLDLIKEAEEGSFKSIENLVEEVKVIWESKASNKTRKKITPFGPPLSQEKLIQSIKEAEKGPFYTHNELLEKFNSWKKTLKK